MTKPVFVPLKTEYWDQFADGSKRIEWRVYGRGWNRDTITVGRAIVLSKGYSGPRLRGRVARVRRVAREFAPLGAQKLFADALYFCAIHVVLNSERMDRNRRA